MIVSFGCQAIRSISVRALPYSELAVDAVIVYGGSLKTTKRPCCPGGVPERGSPSRPSNHLDRHQYALVARTRGYPTQEKNEISSAFDGGIENISKLP